MTDTDRSDRDVHTEHCCSIHGCKYGDANCPVESGAKKQSFPCEACDYDADEGEGEDDALAAAEARIVGLTLENECAANLIGTLQADLRAAEAREAALLRDNNAALEKVLAAVAEIQAREKGLRAHRGLVQGEADVKRSRAKRNSVRPAPGWEVFVQWHTSAPPRFREKFGVDTAEDGEVFETRAEAVEATWDEHEAYEAET